MSAEQDAFNALQLLSVAYPGEPWGLPQDAFYSPSLAKDGDYSRRLKEGRNAHPLEQNPPGGVPTIASKAAATHAAY